MRCLAKMYPESRPNKEKETRLFGPIGQGMLSVGILIANSPADDWEAIFVVSKAILVQARPPGSAPGMYSLWRTSRRIGYSRIVHTSCAESM